MRRILAHMPASSAVPAAALLFIAGTVASAQQTSAVSAATQPASHAGARIVRLSVVSGPVDLDRNVGTGFEPAFANLPIVQGERLRTGDGVAEVEFEDNSSLRLVPHSLIEFPELALGPDGLPVSTVHIVEGTAYASVPKGTRNRLALTFGAGQTVALPPASHVQLQVTGAQPRLDVLDGNALVAAGGASTMIGRKKSMLFGAPAPGADAKISAPALVANSSAPGPFAFWDKQQADYHSHFAPHSGRYGSPYAYGLSDMHYYGGFQSMGGCGEMWRPYLADANWSPYANGVWALYPGAGYSWVSPYPWGWAPFHTGSWTNCPGQGWGWQPNQTWSALQNRPGKRPDLLVHSKLRDPRPIGPTLVVVHDTPLPVSGLNRSRDSFVFMKGSAGLGVPRSTFGKLDHISATAEQHGSVERAAYVAVGAGASNAQSGPRSIGSVPAVSSIHAGSNTVAYAGSARGFVSSGNAGSSMSSAASHSVSAGSFGGISSGAGGHSGGGASSSGGGHR